jgi:formyltetrahydrofolate-dependent phosphoribosylglycinamide formyltransferase/phosphoribosylaminoimidazole-succinocarboxamide synthase
MSHKLVVFISGSGTNLQAIIDACQNHILDAQVVHVISNRKGAYGLERANKHSIPTAYYPYISSKMLRDEYDISIILAGWMHIFGEKFLSNIKKPIINLHPALPGQFPGNDAIGDAYRAFKEDKCTHTGIMVHHVVEEVDAGQVIDSCEIPILKGDSEEDLRDRIRSYEKPLLIKAIQMELVKLNKCYIGKVRDVYDIGNNFLAIISTDRQSAFDRHICDIPGKGNVLTGVSAWWFNQTRHIIDNHYLHHEKNVMIVKKCVPFKVEVVVRGYMTGSTNTSLWTHYQNGQRDYSGHQFRDGYRKNEKLDYNVVTPTTKDTSDKPISGKEVVEMGLMNKDEWLYVEEVALKLFEYGQKMATEKGLILVDTKYELGKLLNTGSNLGNFDKISLQAKRVGLDLQTGGKNMDGKIILIDELHTCDSSRFWDLESYEEKFSQNLEPKKFDKDIVREWIKEQCDPYKDELPKVPKELISAARNAYADFNYKLTGSKM